MSCRAVAQAVDAAGALRFNFVALAPEQMTGGWRDGDGRFEALTGRRPVVESAIATEAEETPGVTVRRGVGVAGLLAGGGTVPHVTGLRTADGEEVTADLVIDTTGRRSPLPDWLDGIGARRPVEEIDDCGFVYFGRHFRSADGSLPPMIGPLLQDYGSLSVLTLPADNGTWGVGLIASSSDAALRRLRHTEVWEKVLASLPLAAHWAEGEALDAEPAVMAKIEDRHRDFSIDGTPIATGFVAVGDAWACTNPSVGRGASIALVHAVALRDLLRAAPAAALDFSRAWEAATASSVEPLYRSTVSFDRHRMAAVEAEIAGQEQPSDDEWELTQALMRAAMLDPDCFRAFAAVVSVLATPGEVFRDAEIFTKVIELGAGWRDEPRLGPSRAELLALVEG